MSIIDRSSVEHGKTYKIKPPVIDEAVYITINDKEINGQLRPVEVFVNSKDMKSFQWISCLTRLISAQFRTNGPFPEFVVYELLQTYDPKGGYVIPKTTIQIPSIVAHIGWILKNHCIELGVIKKDE